MAILAVLVGCGPSGELTASTNKLTWERVNFAGFPSDLPDEGYEAQALTLTNTGKARLDLVINDFDFDHLCIQGYDANPVELPPLNTEQLLTVVIGVCGYDVEGGERDTLVRGSIDFDAGPLKEPKSIAFQFTPEVDQGSGGEDTGG